MRRSSKPSDRRRDARRFGAALRLIRTGRGEGLRALARRVGTSSAYLARVEAGVDAPPSPERLSDLARALDVSEDALASLAGKLARDLVAYLVRKPAATALVRALLEADPPDDVFAELAEVLRARLALPAPLAAARAKVLRHRVDARGLFEAVAAVASPGEGHGLVERLFARGAVLDPDLAPGIAIAHAPSESLAEPSLVVVQAPVGVALGGARARLVLALVYPRRRGAERVGLLAALARIACDQHAGRALTQAAPRSLASVFVREAARVLGTTPPHHGGRSVA